MSREAYINAMRGLTWDQRAEMMQYRQQPSMRDQMMREYLGAQVDKNGQPDAQARIDAMMKLLTGQNYIMDRTSNGGY